MWNALRLAVCAVALWWVLRNVTIFDYVTLTDGSRVRMTKELPEGVMVVVEEVVTGVGQRVVTAQQFVPMKRIARDGDGQLRIEYGLGTTWRAANKALLLACLLIFAPVTLFQALRFQLLLRAQEIDVTFWESIKLCYAGNFLNFITALGTTGGDMFKMYYVSLHTERKTEAVTTVLLDRIVGLYGLFLLMGALVIVRGPDSKIAYLQYVVAAAILAGMVAYAALFSERVRAALNLHRLLARLPFGSHWQRAEAATRRLVRHKRLLLGALASTVVLQVVALAAMVLSAKALDMVWSRSAVYDYATYLAGGVVVAAVPVSFQGLGTMEAFYKHTLFGSHGTLAQLLCLAMVVRALNLFWSLPGVIVTMIGAYRPRIREEDVQFA